MIKAAPPVLVSVTGRDVLVVPMACEVAKVRLGGERLTAGAPTPVPVSRIIWGLLGALSVKASDPTLDPTTLGAKVTLIVQFEGGVVAWSAAVQLLFCTAKSLLATTFEMVKAAVPVFVTVRGRGVLVTPTGCGLLKSKLVDDRLTMGAGPAVPVKSTICGLPDAESVTVIWARRVGGVVPVGVKVTLIVQVPGVGTEDPQVLVSAKSVLFVPVTAMLVILSAAAVWLLRVTV
jgi:hypothetical protein